jgi:hypothetical protein
MDEVKFKKMKAKFKTEFAKGLSAERITRIIGTLGDDDIYECVKGLLKALITDSEQELLINMRAEEAEAKTVQKLRYTKGRIEVLDAILYYVELWRNTAIATTKEEPKNE